MMESLSKELKFMKSDVITTTVCPYFIANSPDKSAKRILRFSYNYRKILIELILITACLTLRFPEIPTEVACEMMIEGILRNERIFSIPGYTFYALPLIR